ncbi:hypothetical protein GH714_014603 [Hevea brasiliensis]|uniref:RRM domain-containing protein n=1 Tax=Hevea brasiliensis TaxID=3981 RepID=A0A6A6K4X2_HEVBR|nr:hypothetical protein GH714_014603 [Hevea brasiliensis]
MAHLFFPLAQKLLQSVAMPISKLGSKFEMWLNLVSCNRNIFVLLANALRGKVVMPVKESETFLSTIGYIDQRVHLDKNIKPDNCRYYSALAAMAAKISYENQAFVENVVRNHWKMDIIGRGQYDFWNDFQEKLTTQAIMFHDKSANPDIIVVAFRGTEPFDADAWCTDFDISWYELDGYMGKIHGGFMKALGLLRNKGWPRPQECEQDDPPLAYYTIRKKLLQILKQNDRTKYILAGHSLGGALAILFVAVLAMHEETELLERLEGVYTFGQPRVGDEYFKKFMESTLKTYNIKYLRFVYCNDVVPRMPTDDSRFLFKHFGTCIYHNSIYKGQVLGIPWEVDTEGLREYMSKFGELEDCIVMKERSSGRSRGFGYVTFASAENAKNALSSEHFLGNRMLEVKVASAKEEMRAPAKKVTRIFVARIPPSVTEQPFEDSVDSLMADTHELEEDDFRPVGRMAHGGYGAYNAYISAATRYAALGAPTLYDHPGPMYGREPARGMGKKIFVGRLPEEATAEDLRQYFGRFGHILDVYVPKDPKRSGHRGFGFVTFAEDGVADRVSRRSHEICGHQVAIDSATPIDDAGPSGNFMMNTAPPFGGYGGPLRNFGRMYGSLDFDDVSIYSFTKAENWEIVIGVMDWVVQDLQGQIGGIGHTKSRIVAMENWGCPLSLSVRSTRCEGFVN